jgi:hypothetical protein
MVVTNNTLCPHCGRPPANGGGATRDHLFSEVFGGKETIVACKHCNNGIGSGVEGKLVGPSSPLTLALQSSGLPHGPLKAAHELGDFMVDLATGEHAARTSVEIVEAGADGMMTAKVFGSPVEVAKVRAGLEKKYGALEILSEKIGSPDDEPRWLNVEVSVDMADLRRYIAKTALCALTYLQGDEFVTGALAGWLRQVLDAPREWPALVKQPPQSDPNGDGAATRSFDTAETVAKSQAWLSKLGLPPLDVVGAVALLVVGAEPKYAYGPHTGFVMSLMGSVLPIGLFAPGVPTGMVAPAFLVQRQGQPIEIIDLAGGRPNGYEP